MKKIITVFVVILIATAMIACDKGPSEETPSRTLPIVPTMESSDLLDPESTPETDPEYEPESDTKGEALIELPRDEF